MNEQQVIALLREECRKAGSQTNWAATRQVPVSVAYVNDVLQGKRGPGRGILSGLGLRKVVEYKKEKSNA